MSEQPPSDFGAYLRQARLARGTSLRQIAAATKISVHVLEALERNEVSRLPGGIFSRAFVRGYAREVGLDPERTLQMFVARFRGQAGVDIGTEPIEVDAPRAGDRRQYVLQAVGLVVVVLAIVAYVFLGRTSVEAPPARQPVPSPTDTTDDEARTERATLGTVPESAPLPVESTTVDPALPEPAAAVAPGLRLAIAATGACWVSATIDGRRSYSRLLDAGERVTIEADAEIELKIGDAGAFSYTLNGLPGRSLGAAGTVTTERLTLANYRDYLAQPAPR